MEISDLLAQRLQRAEQMAGKIHNLLVDEKIDLGTGIMALATAMVSGINAMHKHAKEENTNNEAKRFVGMILTMLTINATDAAAEEPKREIH